MIDHSSRTPDSAEGGTAVLLATWGGLVGGLLVALTVASTLDPSHLVPEAVAEPYGGQYLDVRLVAILFAAPFAGLLASAVSWSASRTSKPRMAVIEGVVSGIAGAAIMGFFVISIGTWWVDLVSRDPNLAAAELVPVWSLLTSFILAFVLEARGRDSYSGTPTLPIQLLLGTGSIAVLLGCLFGAIAGGIAQLFGCTAIVNGCETLTISAAMESGALVGAGIGLVTGLLATLVVWKLRSRPVPSPSSTPA